ncbi:Ribosomal protein S15 [seawater metagenome]|uniref:Ribosomal protein S15 n=1 Tax=seawater metagenome TaxID=1561972 RepID=A0A5E8CLB2_9ZZZZ
MYSLNFESGEHSVINNTFKITLNNITSLIRFTDRPDRLWSPINANQFTELWLNEDNNSFLKDYPNAVLNIDGELHVIELISCKNINKVLELEIKIISDKLIPKIFSNGSLFVDLNKTDNGSPEVQVAIFTTKILELSDHLKKHKKDDHSRKSLLRLVNQREKLLNYLKKKNINGYDNLIKQLGLRK